MQDVSVSQRLAYVGIFLTFRCSFGCRYCINRFDDLKPRKELTCEEWIKGLNRLRIGRQQMVPLTIQGGEPSCHDGFFDIINGLDERFYIDILTNLDFDIERFIREIPPEKLKRDVPYASIRVSYHPGGSRLKEVLNKVKFMQERGYSIGLFAVEHPDTDIEIISKEAEMLGIDFRTKEFLGRHKGRIYGRYKFDEACSGRDQKKVLCRTGELLVAPDGHIHRCHRDLYKGENPVGHILDENLEIDFVYRECNVYGRCNPCDIKLKNNRFQQFGHCSVDIIFEDERKGLAI